MGERTKSLFDAIERQAVSEVDRLLGAGVNPNARGFEDETPLIAACRVGKLETVCSLLRCDADSRLHESHGKTALMEAAQYGHTVVVRFLLQSGINPNQQVENSRDPWLRWTALMHACSRGSVACAKELLEAGADVNSQDAYGETALMKAAQNGHSEVVRVLLDDGADASIQDRSGQTALDHANGSGFTSIVTDLKQATV